MPSDEVARMFQHALGLDTATIGSSAIERALRERLSASGLQSTHDYCEHARSSATELQALIEAVVVPETWFFRDREAFVELARIVTRRGAANRNRTLRLLSLPCSTGEEPYSMAMALFDAGVEATEFTVDAIDISSRALESARHAVYGKNSFRGNDLDFRKRYFDAIPEGYRLREAVRRPVRFVRANLLAADFVPPAPQYDIIFCRNLLIYFDRRTQDRAITIVQRLLEPAGTVFVGPAESGLLFAHAFVWSKVPLAFAFGKAAAVLPERARPPGIRARISAPTANALESPHRYSIPPLRATPRRAPFATINQQPAIPEGLGEAARVPDLREAARLADLGSFLEATRTCEEEIRAHGPSAAASHLMGLISSADGAFTTAARYFRQALYLDPDHAESALHLALLLEKRGDIAGAGLLRSRALNRRTVDAR